MKKNTRAEPEPTEYEKFVQKHGMTPEMYLQHEQGQRALELLRYMTDNWENSGKDLRYVTMLPIPVGWYKEAKALLEASDE